MSATELQMIVGSLNGKKYAQQSGLPNYGSLVLTVEEKKFVEIYQPQQALIIYGSLAPGKPNHSVVESIKGTWQQGTVRGKLENKGWGAELGYFGFKLTDGAEQIEIPAYILFSNGLAQYFPLLDEFEGSGYQRILAPFVLDNGTIGVGNIYALPDEPM